MLWVLAGFWAVFEFSTIFVNVLFQALINDVVPREIIGRFFGVFRIFSLSAGAIYYFWLFQETKVHYFALFLGIGILYGVGLMLMCLMVKEGEYPPPPPVAAGSHPSVFKVTQTYLKECFSRPYYLLVFATVSLSTIAWVPANNFNVPFATSVHMSDKAYGDYLAMTYIISILLSYVYGWLADKFHPVRMALISMSLYAMAALWGGYYARTATTFGIALLAHGVFSGSWLTMAASISQRLLPHEKFGQFASAQFVVLSLSWAGVSALTGKLLDYTHHVYRYAYYVGAGLAISGLICNILLCRRFTELGGVKNYVPPE